MKILMCKHPPQTIPPAPRVPPRKKKRVVKTKKRRVEDHPDDMQGETVLPNDVIYIKVCKYVSKFLLNKSHISKYGIYCSMLKRWHLITQYDREYRKPWYHCR